MWLLGVSLSVPVCPKMSGQATLEAGQKLDKGHAIPKLTQTALQKSHSQTGRHSDGGGLYFRVLTRRKGVLGLPLHGRGQGARNELGAFPEFGFLADACIQHAALRKMVKVDQVDPIAPKRATKASEVRPARSPPSANAPTSSSRRTRPDGATANTLGNGNNR